MTTLLGDARIRIRPDMSTFEQETKRGISSAGPALAAAAKSVVAGAAIAVGAAGVIGLKTAAQMEQAKIAFETMLGSAQKADKFLKRLADFAATTPFEFPELQKAASSLISAGINADKVIPIMRTLGDVTAGMGTGSEGIQRATVALQQMNAAGKITGEDLNQLRDAGIPVYDLLAAATGKSKAKVVELAQAGKLGSKELGQLMKALETGKGLERFNGLMEKQSQSLGGIFSTLKDTVNMQLAGMITPLIPSIKKTLNAVTPIIGTTLAGIGRGLNTAVTFIEKTAIPALKNVFAGMGGKDSPFAPLLKGARELTTKVGPPLISLGGALKKFWDQISPALAAVGREILAVVGPALSDLGDIIADTLIPAVKEFLPAFAPIAKFLIETIGTTVVNVLKGAIDIIKGVIKMISGLLTVFTGVFTGDWSKAWEGIKTIFKGAWDAIVGAARVFLFVIFPGVLRKGATAAWGLFSRVTTGAFTKLGSFLVTRPAWIAGKLASLGGFLKNAAIKGWDVFKKFTTEKLNAVVTFVSGIPGKIGRAFSNLGGLIINSASGGVSSMLRWINENIIDKLDGLTSKFGLNLPRLNTAVGGSRGGGGGRPSTALHQGGTIPGYTPGRDTKTIAVGGGEAIMRPEWTKAVGSNAVHAMNKVARTGGIRGVKAFLAGGGRGFAGGGVVDWVTSGVKKAASSIAAPAFNAFAGRFKGSFAGDLMIGVLRKLLAKINEWGSKQDETAMPPGGVGGAGVKRWAPVVLQALSMVGQPASMLGITLRRMNQESGGNPRAINLWDSNAKAGIPSMGLMQTILPTFNAYAGHLRSRGPYDPLANIYASMRYALARYGSLPAAYNKPGGYAGGTNHASPGWSWVGEKGPELVNFRGGERVMSNRASTAGQGDIHVRVFIGQRELTDIVDTRIERQNNTTGTELRYGRRA